MKTELRAGRHLLVALMALATLACDKKLIQPPADSPQRVMPTAAAEWTCNRLYWTEERGKRLSWKGHVPVVFNFDANVPTPFKAAIVSAMATWNAAAGYELLRADLRPRPPSVPALDNQNTIYVYTMDTPETRRAFGRFVTRDEGVASTRIGTAANRITEADIVFNGARHAFSTTRVHVNSFDVETIALHELGHALGLDDNLNTWSTMFAFGAFPLGVRLRYIDDQSKNLLECEYK